nr:hypothetical protein CFP56_20892 [Quercus suber]
MSTPDPPRGPMTCATLVADPRLCAAGLRPNSRRVRDHDPCRPPSFLPFAPPRQDDEGGIISWIHNADGRWNFFASVLVPRPDSDTSRAYGRINATCHAETNTAAWYYSLA